VVCALAWGAVRGWLAEYEEYAQATIARALRLVGRGILRMPRPSLVIAAPPRSLFGIAFESRPPPLVA